MALIHTLEELVVVFRKRGWYPKHGSQSNMGMRAMFSEVAEIMGRPIAAVDIQLPNHPGLLLNWDSMDRMLAEIPPNKQDSFQEWRVPSMLPVGESAMDAHCHLQLLQAREMSFATEPVPAWETAFSL